MSVLEISRLRKLVDAERASNDTKTPSHDHVTAVVNECSMLACAVMLTLSSLEAHCEDFPEVFHFGKEGARDWTFDGSDMVWRINSLASRNIRMSDRSADAENFFTAGFLPALLAQLDMKDSVIAHTAFMSIRDICKDGDASRLRMLFERMPAHTVISVMRHATTLEGVLGIKKKDIVEQVTSWYEVTERPLTEGGLAFIFETEGPETASDLQNHSLWLRRCLDAYNRRHWPQVVFKPAA